MPHIIIISASVRRERNSHRVALYFKNYLEDNKLATSQILDLQQYQFPIFEERLQYQTNPEASVMEFAGKIKVSHRMILVRSYAPTGININ